MKHFTQCWVYSIHPANVSIIIVIQQALCWGAYMNKASDAHSLSNAADNTQLTALGWYHTTNKTQIRCNRKQKKRSDQGLGLIHFLKEMISELGLERQTGF